MTRKQAIDRLNDLVARHTRWREENCWHNRIVDELLAVERETEARVAERCAEIAWDARHIPRAERVNLADSNDIVGLIRCAYAEAAVAIRREFALKGKKVI